MANLLASIIQLVYWLVPIGLLKFMVWDVSIRDKYANGLGKSLSAVGGIVLTVGVDAFMSAISSTFALAAPGVTVLRTYTHLDFGAALGLLIVGGLLIWAGTGSWLFTRTDIKIRIKEREQWLDRKYLDTQQRSK